MTAHDFADLAATALDRLAADLRARDAVPAAPPQMRIHMIGAPMSFPSDPHAAARAAACSDVEVSRSAAAGAIGRYEEALGGDAWARGMRLALEGSRPALPDVVARWAQEFRAKAAA
jgi:hypothetical protein